MFEIEHPLTGGKLQIAAKDFFNVMTWEQAFKACENLGNGWRLPTIEELEAMHENLHSNEIGNFQSTAYWSSTEESDDCAYGFLYTSLEFSYVFSKDDTASVRAVRSL
jgi:hypothetical protein